MTEKSYPSSFAYTPPKVSVKKKAAPKPKPPKLSPYYIDFIEDKLTVDGDTIVRAFIVDAKGAKVPESSGFGLNRRAAKEDMLRRCSEKTLLKLFE